MFYPSGEGVPDMLMLLVNLTQKVMKEKLMYMSEVEVKKLELCMIILINFFVFLLRFCCNNIFSGAFASALH